jgi:hypothetical protein
MVCSLKKTGVVRKPPLPLNTSNVKVLEAQS